MILRSLLFVPAHKEQLIKKALTTNADAIIFDLEDGCPGEENKQLGIENIKKYYRENDVVRIGKIEHLYEFDINIIMIPKYESYHTLQKELKVIPLIETCKGIYNLYKQFNMDSTIIALAFGELDYKTDNNCSDTRYAKQALINTAHAFGIPAIATPNLDLTNEQRLKVKIREDQEKGFDGSMTIHPKEIELINKEYTPDIEEINKWIAKHEEQDGGVNIKDKILTAPPIYRKCIKLKTYYEKIQRWENRERL